MYSYGYPQKCDLCKSAGCEMLVEPYEDIKGRDHIRIMLIGQDPTIHKNTEKVKKVLMLDKPNGQISRWLRGVFGGQFDHLSIYATNVVKCTLPIVPSNVKEGSFEYLSRYFDNCQSHLIKEIELYEPQIVISFGETAHKLFIKIIDKDVISPLMKHSFNGAFIDVSVNSKEFKYSPCLHIKTFRIAETYGDSVKNFKNGLANVISSFP